MMHAIGMIWTKLFTRGSNIGSESLHFRDYIHCVKHGSIVVVFFVCGGLCRLKVISLCSNDEIVIGGFPFYFLMVLFYVSPFF